MEALVHAGLSNALTVTFLALVVACLSRVLSRRPALLHCLWLLVLVKLVTPPLYEVPIPYLASFGASGQPQPAARAAALLPAESDGGNDVLAAHPVLPSDLPADAFVLDLGSAPSPGALPSERGPEGGASVLWPSVDWIRLLATIWLAGSATFLVLTLYRIARFQLLLRAAHRACEEVQEWVDELAIDLGVERPPSVWFVPAKVAPLLWALFRRPRLIIPIDLWKGLEEDKRATLIVHELAHVRRGDHRTRFFELLVTVLYWWHPVLWWVRQALRDAEEQCCDAWVVWAFPGAAKCYAETLLETLDFLNQSDRPEPLLASGFGKVRHLRKRLTMIMSGKTPRLLSLWGVLGSLGAALLLLPVNATWAQKPAKQETVEFELQAPDSPLPSAKLIHDEDPKTLLLGARDAIAESLAALQADKPGLVVVNSELQALANTDTPTVVTWTLKSDDAPELVVSGTLDEALKKLQEQMKALAKKAPATEKDKAQRRALERAVEALGKLAKQIKQLESSADKKAPPSVAARAKDVRKIVVRRVEELTNTNLTEAQRAAIKEARSTVERLSKERDAKEKELLVAREKLSKLEGIRGEVRLHLPNLYESRIIELQNVPQVGIGVGTARASRSGIGAAALIGKRVEAEGGSDHERIEKLEKKLKELLEEVASLKKDGAK